MWHDDIGKVVFEFTCDGEDFVIIKNRDGKYQIFRCYGYYGYESYSMICDTTGECLNGWFDLEDKHD